MNATAVSLRDLTLADAPILADLLNNKKIWDTLRDYLPHPYSLAHAEEFLEIATTHRPRQHKAILAGAKLVGVCGVHPLDDVYRNTCEIGYWIGEPYWGQGIATQAVRLLVDYATAHFDFVRIEAQVFEINPASARVLEKNGFTHEATMKQRVTKNGVVMDAALYAFFPQQSRAKE